MDSIRKLIFKNIEETLRNNTSLLSVNFGTFDPDKYPKPVGGIIPKDEDSGSEPDDIATERLSVVIRAIVNEDNESPGLELEDILPEIYKTMMADPGRNGLAKDTKKIRTHWLFLDQDFPQAGADVEYEIFYMTKEADPSIGA